MNKDDLVTVYMYVSVYVLTVCMLLQVIALKSTALKTKRLYVNHVNQIHIWRAGIMRTIVCPAKNAIQVSNDTLNLYYLRIYFQFTH